MVEDDGSAVTVVACPTVREADGLALSSRNARLAPEEREQAGCLFLALSEAAALARGGETDAVVLVAAMAREIGATPLARLDYAAVVDERHVRAGRHGWTRRPGAGDRRGPVPVRPADRQPAAPRRRRERRPRPGCRAPGPVGDDGPSFPRMI